MKMKMKMKMKLSRDDDDDDDDIGKSPNLNFKSTVNDIHIHDDDDDGSSGQAPKKVTPDDARQYLINLKDNLTKEEYDHFHDILKAFREHRIDKLNAIQKVTNLFQPHQHLLPGLKAYLPDYYKITFQQPCQPNNQNQNQLQLQLPNHFLQNIKETIASGSGHGDSDNKGKRTSEECNEKVAHRPMKKQNVYILEETVMNRLPQDTRDQVFSLQEKVTERLSNTDHYQKFFKCINYYYSGNVTRSEVQYLVNDLLEAHPDLMEEFNKVIDQMEKIDGISAKDGNRDKVGKNVTFKEKGKKKKSKQSLISNKEKNKAKSFRQLNLSICESCTPSYRLIPKDYHIPEASQRTEMDKQVLNDCCVSVQNYYSKKLRKNKFEINSYKYEDRRFEIDRVLECFKVTIKHAEELVTKTNDKSNETDGQFPLEDYFPGISLKFIKVMYGGYWVHIMNALKRNVSFNLRVLLLRLESKQEEWVAYRSYVDEVWAKHLDSISCIP